MEKELESFVKAIYPLSSPYAVFERVGKKYICKVFLNKQFVNQVGPDYVSEERYLKRIAAKDVATQIQKSLQPKLDLRKERLVAFAKYYNYKVNQLDSKYKEIMDEFLELHRLEKNIVEFKRGAK